jgi:hypothetical protein
MPEIVVVSKTVELPAVQVELLRREANEKGWNLSTLIISVIRSALRS